MSQYRNPKVMSAGLLLSLLLLGTPVQSVQDSVSAQRVEKLESRITEMEKQVLEYRAREDYFRSILESQRWTFGFIAFLVGLVGFSGFKYYVSRVEETREEMEKQMDEVLESLKKQVEENDQRAQNAEGRAFENARVLRKIRRRRRTITEHQPKLEALLNDMLEIASSVSTEVVDEINLRKDMNTAMKIMRAIRERGEADDTFLRRMSAKAYGISENTENPVSMRAQTLKDELEGMMDEEVDESL